MKLFYLTQVNYKKQVINLFFILIIIIIELIKLFILIN